MELTVFIVGLSALVRKLLEKGGYDTNWTILASAILGAGGYLLMQYQPEVWTALSNVLYGLQAAGLVTFTSDMIKKIPSTTVRT